MSPGPQRCPPNILTPRRLAFESRPLLLRRRGGRRPYISTKIYACRLRARPAGCLLRRRGCLPPPASVIKLAASTKDGSPVGGAYLLPPAFLDAKRRGAADTAADAGAHARLASCMRAKTSAIARPPRRRLVLGRLFVTGSARGRPSPAVSWQRALCARPSPHSCL